MHRILKTFCPSGSCRIRECYLIESNQIRDHPATIPRLSRDHREEHSNKTNRNGFFTTMTVEYSIPIDWLKGNIGGQYYCRMYRGKTIIQRRPNRSNHVKSPAEEANQQRFAMRYAGKHDKQ